MKYYVLLQNLPGKAQQAKVSVFEYESWKKLVASGPPWLPQIASCHRNNEKKTQLCNEKTDNNVFAL